MRAPGQTTTPRDRRARGVEYAIVAVVVVTIVVLAIVLVSYDVASRS